MNLTHYNHSAASYRSKQWTNRWPNGPCRNMFMDYAFESPEKLFALLENEKLPWHLLTYAAEYMNCIEGHHDVVLKYSLELLVHDHPCVREGAIYGASNLIESGNPEIIDALIYMMNYDSSPSIRVIAQSYLEDTR